MSNVGVVSGKRVKRNQIITSYMQTENRGFDTAVPCLLLFIFGVSGLSALAVDGFHKFSRWLIKNRKCRMISIHPIKNARSSLFQRGIIGIDVSHLRDTDKYHNCPTEIRRLCDDKHKALGHQKQIKNLARCKLHRAFIIDSPSRFSSPRLYFAGSRIR